MRYYVDPTNEKERHAMDGEQKMWALGMTALASIFIALIVFGMKDCAHEAELRAATRQKCIEVTGRPLECAQLQRE